MNHKLKDKTVCIVSLGYVGLPLALCSVSRHLPTIGFDVDAGKINELFQANDNPGITFTDDPEESNQQPEPRRRSRSVMGDE